MKKEKLLPMLFTTMKGYTKRQFLKDVFSGLIVAIVAMPLSIALALASGVGPAQGLYTAIIAGFLCALLSGSHVQVSGPTAGVATIVAGIAAEKGLGALAVVTIMAGVILVVMGVCRLGGLIKFIPYTITTGFTAGIAVMIFIGQWKDFLGLTYPGHTRNLETVEKVMNVVNNIHTINAYAVLVGVVCLAVLIFWPRISQKIPGSLIAIFVGIAMVKLLKLPVNTIGDLYSISGSLPEFSLPHMSFDIVSGLLSDAVTIAVLCAIMSLLSCVVTDAMIEKRHRPNMELIAQGVGNIASALFGGIPATGAVARSNTNVKNGGRTPVAAMVHAVALLFVLLVLMPYAAFIPMPTMAAILFVVAYNMCQWRPFLHLLKTAPKSDIAVLVITFVCSVVFGLVVAIEVGMLLACILLIKRMSEESNVRGWEYAPDEEAARRDHMRYIPREIRIYEISGPMFFGDTDHLSNITLKDFTRVLILRMRAVPAMDASASHAFEALLDRCQKAGVHVVLSHVNEQPYRTLQRAGFVERLGEDNFCKNINEAIEQSVHWLEENK